MKKLTSLLLFIACLLSSTNYSFGTTRPDVSSVMKQDSVVLTKAKVRDYIKTRKATYRLQMDMKAHADQYDHLIQEFYKKRKALLERRGWTVKGFEAIRDRIIAAMSGMEMAEDLASTQKKHEQEIADIKSNSHFTEEQKAKMIEMENKLREQRRLQYIEPTKHDWPAVKPYRKQLTQLTDWIAGNITEPPEVQ